MALLPRVDSAHTVFGKVHRPARRYTQPCLMIVAARGAGASAVGRSQRRLAIAAGLALVAIAGRPRGERQDRPSASTPAGVGRSKGGVDVAAVDGLTIEQNFNESVERVA